MSLNVLKNMVGKQSLHGWSLFEEFEMFIYKVRTSELSVTFLVISKNSAPDILSAV